MNKVAVLISVYKNDNPDYFREALDSIINQTYDIENINIYQAVDGELPKELEDIIAEYGPFFHKVVYITPNSGLAHALNTLIYEIGDEQFVFRMDSDDIARPDRFDKQIEFMEMNTEVGILGMAIAEFDEVGKTRIRRYPLDNTSLRINISKVSPVAHPTVCFRANVLKQLSGYPTEYHLCEDIALWYKAFYQNVVFANLPNVGLDFRLQANFYKRRSISKAFSEFKVYWTGTIKLQGFSWRLIFPVLRLITRLVPPTIIKLLYNTKIRDLLTWKMV